MATVEVKKTEMGKHVHQLLNKMDLQKKKSLKNSTQTIYCDVNVWLIKISDTYYIIYT